MTKSKFLGIRRLEKQLMKKGYMDISFSVMIFPDRETYYLHFNDEIQASGSWESVAEFLKKEGIE